MNSYKWAEPIFQVLPISALCNIFTTVTLQTKNEICK